MSESIPEFFVPAATPENQEQVYAEFARRVGRKVPSLAERVYSIEYRHDGIDWTATVGKPLRGTKTETRRSKHGVTERQQPVSDPAIALAIFPGDPYIVVTNQGIVGNVGSRWANPFFAGRPTSVTPFKQ
jgi:hypothetical protein